MKEWVRFDGTLEQAQALQRKDPALKVKSGPDGVFLLVRRW